MLLAVARTFMSRVRRERGARDRALAAEERMLLPAVEPVAFDEEPVEVEPRDGPHEGADRGMEVVGEDAAFEFGAFVHEELHLHLVVEPVELPQRLGQRAVGMGDERIDDAETDLSRESLAQGQDAVEVVVHRVQHPLDLLVGQEPPVGERESRPPALAQAKAEPFLEFGHVKRNRRG
jgi:hypothetical protein